MNYDLFFHKNSIMPRLTAVACLICLVVFVGLNMAGKDITWAQAEKWGHYPDSALWTGKPWALITSVFVHFEFFHVAFNVYWLWILGNILEENIGPWRWLAFFLGAAVVSSSTELMATGSMGIGMSGVGYALFGYGWIAKNKVPAFKVILNEQTVVTFLLWLVGCFIATQLGWASIANAAHLGGLVFGATVAALFAVRWKPVLSGIVLAALLGLGVLPFFWCPLSPDWTGNQATAAFNRHDYQTAIYWFRRSIARGGDESWATSNIALAYFASGNIKDFQKTMAKLSDLDPKAAQKVEAELETPDKP
jgi:GlpG protein